MYSNISVYYIELHSESSYQLSIQLYSICPPPIIEQHLTRRAKCFHLILTGIFFYERIVDTKYSARIWNLHVYIIYNV